MTAAHAPDTGGDVLARICAATLEEVRRRMALRTFAAVDRAARDAGPVRGFRNALATAAAAGRSGLIAEIKKASPSKGLIRADFDPPALARAYAEGGATCLSVLTDGPWFQGRDEDMVAARAACALPVIRKDFMLTAWQIAESRALGADCVLLILAARTDGQAADLAAAAHGYGMDVLVEVHDMAEAERALALPSSCLLGINNRNLKTLSVDLATTEQVARIVPKDRLLVAESGIHTPADLRRMAAVGARCFLVGESLMRQPDVAAAVRTLLA
jgi:indole-3-glycerol phosphate synthase